MNARFRVSIVGICIASLLSGCGSVTSGIAFSPPPGWTGTPAVFGHFQMWMKNGQQRDSAQILMLVKGSSSQTAANLTDLPPQYNRNMTMVKHGPVTMCGTQSGEQYTALGEGRDHKQMRIEMTTTVIGSDRYTAMYLRPAAMTPDAQAETAIHSLCPVK
ncbi:MAG TPA: hypothetical protein VKT72_01775 [Candidatus Baltobacteraceae bacterium]|nr:hypothetical protein [Candidatus Baltobacteraceae bacterium]